MWMLNLYFYLIILLALRSGELLTLLVIIPVFFQLHMWLEQIEDINGTSTNIKRSSSYDSDHIHRLLDDTHSDLDNTTTR